MTNFLKVFFLSCVSLFIFSCASQAQTQTTNVDEVTFNAITRGSSENIIVVDQTVFYKTHNSSNTYTISKEQRNKLDKYISNINLSAIAALKAPTNKRLYDGALHATLSVKTNKNTYTSSQFDDDTPPTELKPIVALLRSFVK
ncbi:hypothetical protein [Tenacibaculum amylolyticum]|uniref:hypothetical protein n=1 Tax=Tenacibaculum amylolyticum TaxID=104269 RepID=UPI003894FF4E